MHVQRRVRHLPWLLILIIWIAAGCQPVSTYPYVSLAEPPPYFTPTAAPQTSQPILRVAIAAVISPRGTVEGYTPLLDYLAQHTGRSVRLIQRKTYAEVNDLVRDGGVDLAFICTGAYVQGRREFAMDLLAVPQVDGQTVYYSYIIVPADSPARRLIDLRDKVFAFTDPMSNTGRLMPIYLLWQIGETPQKFFRRTIYTFSHDNSIQAVAKGLVDGAAVDSLVYHYALSREPSLAERTRVIAQSDPCGMPPVITPAQLDAELKAELRDILLTMHLDPTGKNVLNRLLIDRFVPVDERAYDSVHEALVQIGDLL